MDDDLKRDVLTSVAPAAVPILRFGIRNHFEEKRLEKREKHEVRMAKHQAEAFSQATGADVPA
jgi:hypothetical protein